MKEKGGENANEIPLDALKIDDKERKESTVNSYHLLQFAFKMILIMLYCSYGKTTKSQCGSGGQGPTVGGADPGYSNLAHGPGGSITGFGALDLGTNGEGFGSRAGYSGSPAESLPTRGGSGLPASTTLGWAATRAPEPGGRAGVPGRVAAPCRARRIGDRFASAHGPESKAGPAGARVGGLSLT